MSTRLLMMTLLLASCGGSQTAAERARVASFLAALDRAGDGQVDRADYRRVAYAAPPFAEVDLDGDGNLDAAELVTLLRGQDPMDFDRQHRSRQPPRQGPPKGKGGARPGPTDLSARHHKDALSFMETELVWAGHPGLLGEQPEPPATEREARLIVERYREAYAEAGLVFPEQLPHIMGVTVQP
jgi:hypothetical protein